MAITTTLLNVSTTRSAVSTPQLAQANLVLKDTSIVQISKTTVQEVTTFTLKTSTIVPLVVTVRRALDSREKTIHYALKISTWERSIDADGLVVEEGAVEAGMWVTRPMSKYDITDTNIETLLGNVFGLWFAGVDGSNVPTQTLLNALRLGVTNLY